MLKTPAVLTTIPAAISNALKVPPRIFLDAKLSLRLPKRVKPIVIWTDPSQTSDVLRAKSGQLSLK